MGALQVGSIASVNLPVLVLQQRVSQALQRQVLCNTVVGDCQQYVTLGKYFTRLVRPSWQPAGQSRLMGWFLLSEERQEGQSQVQASCLVAHGPEQAVKYIPNCTTATAAGRAWWSCTGQSSCSFISTPLQHLYCQVIMF